MEKVILTIGFLCWIFVLQIAGQKQNTKSKSLIINCHNCKIISLPKPEYPKIANAVNISGEVKVQILIDEQGTVIEAKAISGHLFLREEAEKAAYKAKFKPTAISNNPVKMRSEIVYNFLPNGTVQTQKQTQVSSAPKTGTRPPHPGGILIGKAIKLPKPSFVFCNCRFGNVKSITSLIVQSEIDEKGNVSKATAVSSHPVLKFKSEQAAKKSKFSPSIALGIPVKAKALIVYRFTIVDKWSVKLKDINVKDIQIENLLTN